MAQPSTLRRLAFCVWLVALAACGAPGAGAPTASVAAPGAATPTAATAFAPAETATTGAEAPTSTAVAAVARPSATPDPLLPTAPPLITPGPVAPPAPLPAGWWDGSVCYEIFVRSFFDSDGDGNGDLQGLIQKLDYINDGDPASRSDLGATCIWLMPVAEAASYHGYDTVDYYSVEQDYGTNEDFKQLVREAEARDIKVIIDLVLNHTSSQHPWFQEAMRDPESPYRDWFLWSQVQPPYSGPFNNQVWHPSPVADEFYYGLFWSEMPDLNYRNPAVTEEARKISAFWIEEMGVAGFRLDAIKHLIEFRAVQADTPETHNWLRDYRDWLDTNYPGTYTIGEIFGATPESLAPYYPDQLGYYFAFNVGQAIEVAADFGDARRYLAEVTAYSELPYQRWAPFLTNHDQNRIMSSLDNDPAKGRLAAIALLTLPGMPYLYYGEEIGMVGVKPDEDLRTPMQWTREETGGFTAGLPWRQPQRDYPEKHVAAQDNDPNSLLNTYRELIHLHVQTPALAGGAFLPLLADNAGVAGFLRVDDDDAALVLINFSPDPAERVQLDLAAQALLAAGTYELTPLFGAPAATLTPLTLDADGAITGYTPLLTIPPQTGYIFRLSASEGTAGALAKG